MKTIRAVLASLIEIIKWKETFSDQKVHKVIICSKGFFNVHSTEHFTPYKSIAAYDKTIYLILVQTVQNAYTSDKSFNSIKIISHNLN